MIIYDHLILPLHVLSCFFMTGVIWIVQIVHYPAFNFVTELPFTSFHRFHSSQISWIVVPVMGIELITGLSLAYSLGGIWSIQLLLILALWAVTFFISVPLHNKLGQNRDDLNIKKLVLTNWLRTCLWTFRTVLILLTVSIQLAS